MNCVKLSWELARQYEPAPAGEDLTGFERMAEIAEQQLRATLEAHGFGMDEAWDIMHQWSKRIEALTGDEHKRVGGDDPRGYDKEGGEG